MLFYLIAGLPAASFLMDAFLEYLNSTRRSPELPEELKDIYNEAEYRISLSYEKVKQRFSLVKGAFSLSLILAMLFFGGFTAVDEIARTVSADPVVITLLFFGIIMVGSDLLHIPFQWYGVFVIEEKFGFNRSTPMIFITDKLKGMVLGIVIGGGLLALISWFYL
jgi:STE24 endopeptidase